MWNVDLDTFLVVDTLHWIMFFGKPTVGDNYPRETHWFSHRFCGFRWIFFKGQLKPGWHLKPLGLFSPQNMRFYWKFSFQPILGFQDMWTVFQNPCWLMIIFRLPNVSWIIKFLSGIPLLNFLFSSMFTNRWVSHEVTQVLNNASDHLPMTILDGHGSSFLHFPPFIRNNQGQYTPKMAMVFDVFPCFPIIFLCFSHVPKDPPGQAATFRSAWRQPSTPWIFPWQRSWASTSHSGRRAAVQRATNVEDPWVFWATIPWFTIRWMDNPSINQSINIYILYYIILCYIILYYIIIYRYIVRYACIRTCIYIYIYMYIHIIIYIYIDWLIWLIDWLIVWLIEHPYNGEMMIWKRLVLAVTAMEYSQLFMGSWAGYGWQTAKPHWGQSPAVTGGG